MNNFRRHHLPQEAMDVSVVKKNHVCF